MAYLFSARPLLRRGIALLLVLAALLPLAACKNEKKSTQTDIVSQKVTTKGRTPITVMVKYAYSINGLEQAIEEKFPDIDIVQVGNYTRDMGTAEYERRLKNDDLTDIVMTWPLDVGQEYWKDRLLDLSGFDFTNRYPLSMLNSIAQDGNLYYLPGPSQMRGIVYNKTLFEEKGWQVPTNYEQFIALCQTIEASGIRALQLGFQNQEVLDTAFIGFNYGGTYSRPQDIQWISDYNNGVGSFGEHFSGALDVFAQMIDAGVFQPEDLSVDYTKREEMIFSRQCAMVEDSVLMARMGGQRTGTTDEFALMPFFNPGESNDWVRLYMVCYVGVNKHLAEAKNKEKYNLVLKLMEYLSTPEGQEAMMLDTGGMFSNLNGVSATPVPEIEQLQPALSQGRYAPFPQLKNAQGALRRGLAGILRGDITKDQVIAMVDAQNQSPPTSVSPSALGRASENFSLVETGNYITDAMAQWGQCQIALFLDNGKDGQYNNKGLNGRLYQGDITAVDLSCILPDYKSDDPGTLWTAQITGADLKKTLEYSIPVENEKTGWFYYFSGLKMEFSPTAPQGSRIQKITLASGKPLEDNTLYTIAVMGDTVPEEFLQNCTKTNETVQSMLEDAIQTAETISPSKDGRFTILP